MYKIIIVGMLGTCLAWFVSGDRLLKYIEWDLDKNLSAVITEQERQQFEYTVAGRDVILHVHNVANRRDLELIREKIAAVPGVGRVLLIGGDTASSSIAPAISALSRSNNRSLFAQLDYSENGLTLIGNATASESTAKLLEELGEAQNIEINNLLDFHNGMPPRQWLTFLYVFTEMPPVEGSGRFLITDKGVSYFGDDLTGAERIAHALDSSDLGLPVRIQPAQSFADSFSGLGFSNVSDCNDELGELLAAGAISFKHESDELSASSLETLEAVRDLGGRCSSSMLVVEGHTDSLGSSEFNRRLSQRRADVVKSQLVLKGFDEKMIKAVGAGEENPIATNETRAGRATNRRIEIRFSPFTQG